MVLAAEILSAKILIVDDQKSNVMLLERMLAAAGYTCVASTTDPLQVAALHRANRYDLILLDLLMPKMYGFQVIEIVKEIENSDDLPILVVSAQPDYKKRAVQAGAKRFIAKPIDRVDLLGHVHDMLYARMSREQARDEKNAMERVQQDLAGMRLDSEELFQQIAAGIPDALWVRETKGDLIRYVNPAWEKITGQHLEAGDRIDKIFAAIHPEDLQRVRHESEIHSGGGVDLVCRIVCPDKTVHRMHVRTFAIRDSNQRTVRVAGIMEDITESKAAADGIA